MFRPFFLPPDPGLNVYLFLFVCFFSSHEYFQQAAEDLAAYSTHGKRQGIEVEDVGCLFRRQRTTGPGKPIEDLIRRFLPLEYVEEVVQVARANNLLDPAMKGHSLH